MTQCYTHFMQISDSNFPQSFSLPGRELKRGSEIPEFSEAFESAVKGTEKVQNSLPETVLKPYQKGEFLFLSKAPQNTDWQTVFQALAKDNSIKHLVLSGQNLGKEGAKALAKALASNTAIAWLILSKNQIEDAGAKSLAEVIKTNPHLRHVVLDQNEISDEGATALALAVKQNTHIQTLFLQGNKIGDGASRAFSELLKRKLPLKLLNVSQNLLSVKSAAQLHLEGTPLGVRVYANS